METLTRDDFAKVAVTLWAIWFARRKILHEGEYQSPLSTHLFIERYLKDLAIASPSIQAEAKKRANNYPKWIPPSNGCAKLNVDAATSKSHMGGAMGVICRSENGEFLGASCLTVHGISDPSVLEAMACREALALAQDLQLRRIVVATDCLSVVNHISTAYAGKYSRVLDEIKVVSSLFDRVLIKHERRESNYEAHRLARSAVSAEVGRQVWLVEPPAGLCILNNVMVQ
jgi:ribonuclease HI